MTETEQLRLSIANLLRILPKSQLLAVHHFVLGCTNQSIQEIKESVKLFNEQLNKLESLE